MRVQIKEDPFPYDPNALPWTDRGEWPCSWVRLANAPSGPYVSAYRLSFVVIEDSIVRIHVTADERYELYLDGVYIGRGSERGDENHWFFETYDLPLSRGDHQIVARVWKLGDLAAFAQVSSDPGFLLCPQDPVWQQALGTGLAPWEARVLDGYEFIDPLVTWGTGHNVIVDGERLPWGWENGEGEGWTATETRLKGMGPGINDRNPRHYLRPATLPPMLESPVRGMSIRHVSEPPPGPTNVHPFLPDRNLRDEQEAWNSLIEGHAPCTIPAHSRRRILIDANNYICAYPRLVVSGGKRSKVRIHWQESLYESLEGPEKGNRDQIDGKFFTTVWIKKEGVGDTFLPSGETQRFFDTLWWQAGRYIEILVETDEEALTIEKLQFVETHYPYEFRATFESDDPRLSQVAPIMRRALEMCSHETYMDCPYFEQLQYIGDTRIQALVTYCLTDDDRLARKALLMFDASRRLNGLTQSRYPSRVLQVIPPFSLWYIGMAYDFALYRGDLNFIRSLMPGIRGILDTYHAHLGSNGLLGPVDGWNYVDWVPGWEGGMPKDASAGYSGILNLHLALTLRKAAQLEIWLNEPELAGRNLRHADSLIRKVNDLFWSETRGLYANDLDHSQFSEHAQCLALLTGAVPPDRIDRVVHGLLEDPSLDRMTIYFSHYLFETLGVIGRTDRILDRMALWFEHLELGLKTTIEAPEPTRSDCHAWGAHPLFHFPSTLLGIRPTEPGFHQVSIRPQLGTLTRAVARMPSPFGDLLVEATQSADRLEVLAELPEKMTGTLMIGSETIQLSPGKNHASLRLGPSHSR